MAAADPARSCIPSPLYPAYQAQVGPTDVTPTAIYAVCPLVRVPAVYLLAPSGTSCPRVESCAAVSAIAAAGSLVLALAPSTGWLILGRVTSGIALPVITGGEVAVATAADKAGAGGGVGDGDPPRYGCGSRLGGALTRCGPTPGLLPFGVNLVLLGVVFIGLAACASPGLRSTKGAPVA